MILLFALAVAASIPVAPVPPEKAFGSWTVACDNLGNCGGISAVDGDGGADGKAWIVHFSRRGSAAAPVKVEGFLAFQEGEPGAVTMRIDGKTTPFGFTADGNASGDAAAMLAAMANAHKIELVDAKGKAAGFVPASGASAALRYVDDRQGRAGRVTALVAKGPKSVSAVPAPPAAPRIAVPAASKAPPKKLGKADISRIKKLSEFCDGETNPDWVTTYYRLDAGHTVALIPCGMGAYQSNSLVIVIDERGKWTPAAIEQYERNDEPLSPADFYTLTEADFDTASRLLLTMARGRGLNDCGLGASWAWDGRMFRLARYDALNVCAGAPPGTWLPRWHSANDPFIDE